MSNKFEEARVRHRDLMLAASGPIRKEFAAAVEAASIFDLQWLSGRIDEQLEETPHHVADPEALRPMLERLRRQQMIIASTLQTKIAIQSKNENLEVRLWQILGIFGTFFGIIIGAIIAIYF